MVAYDWILLIVPFNVRVLTFVPCVVVTFSIQSHLPSCVEDSLRYRQLLGSTNGYCAFESSLYKSPLRKFNRGKTTFGRLDSRISIEVVLDCLERGQHFLIRPLVHSMLICPSFVVFLIACNCIIVIQSPCVTHIFSVLSLILSSKSASHGIARECLMLLLSNAILARERRIRSAIIPEQILELLNRSQMLEFSIHIPNLPLYIVQAKDIPMAQGAYFLA